MASIQEKAMKTIERKMIRRLKRALRRLNRITRRIAKSQS
jgi:hypothetical protein